MVDTNTTNYDAELYTIKSWDDLNLSTDILRGIYSYGFEEPSPIQCKAIKPIMLGKDVIAQAQSGTGKTATFIISSLSLINVNNNTTQVLLLSPTRELATQTYTVLSNLGSMMKGLNIQNIYNNKYNYSDICYQHIIVSCPGKVLDLLKQNKINGNGVKLIVLDEADELLTDGFKHQIQDMFQYFNNEIQVGLFSATLPDYLESITRQFMRDPVRIYIQPNKLTLDGISQYFVAVQNDTNKYETLKDLYSYISLSQCIIYCNSVKRVVHLYEEMLNDNFPVCCIHSQMDKSARDISFTNFKNGKYRVLISSDITSRGIDIQQVSIVINFDVPNCVHNYLHRIGRSGRWGRKGVGLNFITKYDVDRLRQIENHYSCQITELPSNMECLM